MLPARRSEPLAPIAPPLHESLGEHPARAHANQALQAALEFTRRSEPNR